MTRKPEYLKCASLRFDAVVFLVRDSTVGNRNMHIIWMSPASEGLSAVVVRVCVVSRLCVGAMGTGVHIQRIPPKISGFASQTGRATEDGFPKSSRIGIIFRICALRVFPI